MRIFGGFFFWRSKIKDLLSEKKWPLTIHSNSYSSVSIGNVIEFIVSSNMKFRTENTLYPMKCRYLWSVHLNVTFKNLIFSGLQYKIIFPDRVEIVNSLKNHSYENLNFKCWDKHLYSKIILRDIFHFAKVQTQDLQTVALTGSSLLWFYAFSAREDCLEPWSGLNGFFSFIGKLLCDLRFKIPLPKTQYPNNATVGITGQNMNQLHWVLT